MYWYFVSYSFLKIKTIDFLHDTCAFLFFSYQVYFLILFLSNSIFILISCIICVSIFCFTFIFYIKTKIDFLHNEMCSSILFHINCTYSFVLFSSYSMLFIILFYPLICSITNVLLPHNYLIFVCMHENIELLHLYLACHYELYLSHT